MEVTSVTQLAAQDLADFVRIYEDSFPPSEREQVEPMLLAIAAGELRCFVARDGGALVGLAVLLRLQGVPAEYLEYLAVDRRLRSRGIGGHLLQHLLERLGAADDGPEIPRGIVFEVEAPEAAEDEERSLRLRRIEFYLRNGSSLVACAPRYRAPDLEGSGVVPYRLMWLPGRDGPPELDGPLLRECVAGILTEGYGLDQGHPLVREVLTDLTC